MTKVVKHTWHLFDASSQTVGRMSTHLANLLMGKHKPNVTPNVDGGDYVVVINAAEVKFTGDKWQKKLYRKHTGYVKGYAMDL
jgi:large subunit ribosomal protein L13